MLELFFVVALVLPPAVIALSAAALAIGVMPQRRTSPRLREHHA